jgi:hypothetical protein
MGSKGMKKRLPELASDEEAEAFVAGSDLTEYDLSEMRPGIIVVGPKVVRRVRSIRLSDELWTRVEAYRGRFELAPPLAVVVETLIERGLRRSEKEGTRNERDG